mmetsp:Transcript_19804/g.37266  ORF Transcript_19804/g.37266 Transcript_19804/m.37266 type:complete len:630 (+) Transcript_19804:1610-3499(+)
MSTRMVPRRQVAGPGAVVKSARCSAHGGRPRGMQIRRRLVEVGRRGGGRHDGGRRRPLALGRAGPEVVSKARLEDGPAVGPLLDEARPLAPAAPAAVAAAGGEANEAAPARGRRRVFERAHARLESLGSATPLHAAVGGGHVRRSGGGRGGGGARILALASPPSLPARARILRLEERPTDALGLRLDLELDLGLGAVLWGHVVEVLEVVVAAVAAAVADAGGEGLSGRQDGADGIAVAGLGGLSLGVLGVGGVEAGRGLRGVSLSGGGGSVVAGRRVHGRRRVGRQDRLSVVVPLVLLMRLVLALVLVLVVPLVLLVPLMLRRGLDQRRRSQRHRRHWLRRRKRDLGGDVSEVRGRRMRRRRRPHRDHGRHGRDRKGRRGGEIVHVEARLAAVLLAVGALLSVLELLAIVLTLLLLLGIGIGGGGGVVLLEHRRQDVDALLPRQVLDLLPLNGSSSCASSHSFEDGLVLVVQAVVEVEHLRPGEHEQAVAAERRVGKAVVAAPSQRTVAAVHVALEREEVVVLVADRGGGVRCAAGRRLVVMREGRVVGADGVVEGTAGEEIDRAAVGGGGRDVRPLARRLVGVRLLGFQRLRLLRSRYSVTALGRRRRGDLGCDCLVRHFVVDNYYRW